MKKKEEEKKDKVSDMITKDSVKKDDDEKKEEKPDTRGMYAKIAMVKNKLRSMGQANPMVMAVDACEERTPAEGDKSFDKMRPGGSNSPYNEDGTKKESKPSGPKGGDSQRPQTGKPKPKKEPKYNPYGKGATANPSNMSGSTGP